MRDDFGRGKRSGLEAALERAGAASGREEAGCEEIAGAGRVDHSFHGSGRYHCPARFLYRQGACRSASHELTPRALNENLIRSAAVTFLEGYLWGPERPRHAMLRAAQIAHEAERTVAFTLSESLCIPGRKEGVLGMIEGGMIDVLFANEDEAMHLSGATDLGAAIARLQPLVSTLIVTRGPAGALAIERGRRVEIAAAPVEKVVDTTGAGDLFAAGFLAARCRARPLERCLEAGALAAAEVISHFGARPEANLREIVRL